MKLDTSKVMASFEAIEFQGRRSKMFSEITFFFQEIIDYRDSLIKKGTANKEIARLVREKTHNEIDGLAAILKKYTRIRYDFKLFEGSISLAFYTLYNPDPALDQMDGTRHTKLDPKKDDSLSKRLEDFRKGVDTTTGKLPEVIDSSIVSDKAVMGLCIDSMFLIKMYHSKLENMSAPELAFIVTHEVGHALMWAFNADILYRRLDDLTRPVTVNVKSHADIAPLVKKCRDDIKVKNKIVPKDTKVDKMDVLINKALDTLDELSKDRSQVARVNKFAMWYVGLLVTAVRISTNAVSIRTLINMYITKFRADVSNRKKSVKDSDFQFNLIDAEQIEFMCDEYASMHGGGPFGVSGLEKVSRYCEVVFGKKMPRKPSSKISNLILQSNQAMFKRVGYWNQIKTHGSTYDRYQQMANSLLKTLRADALSPEIEDAIMREYEVLMKTVEKSKVMSRNNSEELDRVIILLSKAVSLNDMMLFLMNGKRDIHYQTIMKASEHLMNTSLVYHKKRLARM